MSVETNLESESGFGYLFGRRMRQYLRRRSSSNDLVLVSAKNGATKSSFRALQYYTGGEEGILIADRQTPPRCFSLILTNQNAEHRRT